MPSDVHNSAPKATPAPVRAHVPDLSAAQPGAAVALSADQARHLTRVRRLGEGAAVELFDDAGRTARGYLREGEAGAWQVELTEAPVERAGQEVTVYCAIPKGNRADWMVEKLGELGVARLVPLRTARSVVDPGGGKLDRFRRIAREAAKQSRRRGVLQVEEPLDLSAALAGLTTPRTAAVLATERPGAPLGEQAVTQVFIGPEGGWTPQELEAFTTTGVPAAMLTQSILRVETAAICAAAVVMMGREAKR